jgi:hypothetical protein
LVVVWAGFFFPPPLVVVVAAVVVGMGEVGVGIETCVELGAATVGSPLESEPQPASTARAAVVPRTNRIDRPTRIGRQRS